MKHLLKMRFKVCFFAKKSNANTRMLSTCLFFNRILLAKKNKALTESKAQVEMMMKITNMNFKLGHLSKCTRSHRIADGFNWRSGPDFLYMFFVVSTVERHWSLGISCFFSMLYFWTPNHKEQTGRKWREKMIATDWPETDSGGLEKNHTILENLSFWRMWIPSKSLQDWVSNASSKGITSGHS